MKNGQKEKKLVGNAHYSLARETAKRKRVEFNIKTRDITIPLLKKVCRQEGIKVDLVDKIGSKIRAAYFFDEDGCSILLRKDMPREPKLFALAHELKHHFLDKKLIADEKIECGDYNANKEIEIAAEIFAAEFLFPEEEMRLFLESMGIEKGSCTEEDVVEIKLRSPVPVSYAFICKRLIWFRIIEKDEFVKVQFRKLEEKLHPPFYKEEWFKQARARKRKLQ